MSEKQKTEVKTKPEDKPKVEEKIPGQKIKSNFARENVYSEDQESKNLYEQSRFGELKDNKVSYSLVEALYLLEKKKMDVLDDNKPLNYDSFLKRAKKIQPNFWVRYCVFRDLRSRGYIVKTALKFGADFRVYDRGIKPGEDHAKWIVFPVHESEVLTWYEFSAKNRVAHSTRKRLLLGIVDEEEDVTYYECRWIRP
ncbi:MAG: tRNA-intron lyase [Nanoarchaeota archaeon]